MWMGVCLGIWVCTCIQRSEDIMRSNGVRVTCGCELPEN